MENKEKLICPLCKGKEFKQEQGKIDSHWGFSAHKVGMMICNKCSHIMLFSKGNTFWGDFD